MRIIKMMPAPSFETSAPPRGSAPRSHRQNPNCQSPQPSHPKNNAAVAHLCAELNATETLYPGTDVRMIFKAVSS